MAKTQLPTYIVLAIFFNPLIVLHIINTIISRLSYCSTTVNPFDKSTSRHSFIQRLGPRPDTEAWLDVQNNPTGCWAFMLAMVIVQSLAYGWALELGKKKKGNIERRDSVDRVVDTDRIRTMRNGALIKEKRGDVVDDEALDKSNGELRKENTASGVHQQHSNSHGMKNGIVKRRMT